MLHLARRRPSETGASLVLNSQKSCRGHRKGKKNSRCLAGCMVGPKLETYAVSFKGGC